jgi:2-polyprenyl-3-methyl-5-hydroxy-6-metoxy-1,4-benzoquinol methylase
VDADKIVLNLIRAYRQAKRRRSENVLRTMERRLSALERAVSDEEIRQKIQFLLEIIDEKSRPNINALCAIARDIPPAHLNLKFYGYELAERLRAAIPIRTGLQPQYVGLKSKATTQEDMESEWVSYWCSEYKFPVVFHRKLWEFCYVSQALQEKGMITPGRRGLGFGCGLEPLPSYLATRNIDVVATDAPPSEGSERWARTNQHGAALDQIFKSNLVDRIKFDKHVSHRFVDMNDIPSDLRGFDFCWSICALEHLGTIRKGVEFIENSLDTLKPGGIAVHTTEFNFFDDAHTIDNWGTVLFQKSHFQEIENSLVKKGHRMEPLDFNVGRKPMDRFIDLAPFEDQWGEVAQESWQGDQRHLKVACDGFVVTCFGLIITKSSKGFT